MKVECPDCHKVYNLPDDKLPTGKNIAFPCPACKGIIKIELRSKSAQVDMSSLPKMKKKGKASKSDTVSPAADLRGEALKEKILKSLSALPPMPQIMQKAQEIISDPNSSFHEISGVLETDQALATRVLKLANSAYYGLNEPVSSIHQASMLLGYQTLLQLITVVSTSKLLGSQLKGYGLNSGDLWRHSLAVGYGSKIIAKKKKPELENDAFSAGLIHDAGKLILDKYVFERKGDFDAFMKDGQKIFLNAEKEILGFDHSEIAFAFCTAWKIPEIQAKAIRYHHQPSLPQESELSYILHIADWIAAKAGIGASNGRMYTIENGAMEFLGLQEEDLSSIADEVTECVKMIAEKMLIS